MQVIQHLWRRRRVRIAGVLDQVAVDTPDDLAAIYRDYWELVYKRCYATLQDHEAASDATQDVFEQALTSFEAIRHDVVRGLMDLARTISYERKRRPKREVSLAELTLTGQAPARGSDNDPAEIAEQHRVLHAVWSALSPVERRYVADKFAGFSFEEIARRRGRALGTVSSNLARAHEHARKMREPLLPGILALAAWRRLTELSRRARNAAQSGSVAAAAQPVGSFTVSLTLAGLVAGAVPAVATASSGFPHRAVAMMVPTNANGAAAGTLQAGLAVGSLPHATSATASAPRGQTGAGPAGSSTLSHLGLPGSAMTETPEDTEISSATPSPNYQQDHTIVALGHGDQCSCRVLLLTNDGGATWLAQTGAPAGDQIVLSPTFPQDSSIFVGYATGVGTTSDYWTPGFGQRFVPLLGAPAGSLTLPAGFDRGDNRIIVSTPNEVWSYSWPSASLQPLLVEPARSTPAVATAYGSPDTGVMVLTTTEAFDPHQPFDAVASGGGETLWACAAGQPCRRSATLPLPAGAGLVASPRFAADHAVVAYGPGRMAASSDSGTTFAEIALPSSNVPPIDVRFAPSSSGPALWVTTPRGAGWALMRRPSLSSPWQEADGGNPAIIAEGGRIVVIEAQRLLYLLAQGGLLCSVNGGVTWEARCPAA